MSRHCTSSWELGDPLEDAPIKEIAAGVRYYGGNTPGAYALISRGDTFIFYITRLLNIVGDELKIPVELIETTIPDTIEHKEDSIEVTVSVLKELGRFDDGKREDDSD